MRERRRRGARAIVFSFPSSDAASDRRIEGRAGASDARSRTPTITQEQLSIMTKRLSRVFRFAEPIVHGSLIRQILVALVLGLSLIHI